MTDVPGSPIRRAAKVATSPVRSYINNHFEMVKQEVRQHNPVIDIDSAGPWQRVAELENSLAETSLYQAKLLARLSDDISQLSARINDLERVVRQLAAIAAASSSTEPSNT